MRSAHTDHTYKVASKSCLIRGQRTASTAMRKRNTGLAPITACESSKAQTHSPVGAVRPCRSDRGSRPVPKLLQRSVVRRVKHGLKNNLRRYGTEIRCTLDHVTFLTPEPRHVSLVYNRPSSAASIAPIHSQSVPFKSPTVLSHPNTLLLAPCGSPIVSALSCQGNSTPDASPAELSLVATYGL